MPHLHLHPRREAVDMSAATAVDASTGTEITAEEVALTAKGVALSGTETMGEDNMIGIEITEEGALIGTEITEEDALIGTEETTAADDMTAEDATTETTTEADATTETMTEEDALIAMEDATTVEGVPTPRAGDTTPTAEAEKLAVTCPWSRASSCPLRRISAS